MKVAVSGAMGRLGSAIALGISNANDLQLSGVYAPGHVGKMMAGLKVEDAMERRDAHIVVECAPPHVVMENLKTWHSRECVLLPALPDLLKTELSH